MDTVIMRARNEDRKSLQDFLEKANVSTDGLLNQMELFSLLKNEEGEILGTIGFEIHHLSGLLRSLVVHPTVNEEQMILLFKSTFAIAKEKRLNELYLATYKEEAKPFFQMIGFTETDPSEVSPVILETYENNMKDFVDNGLYFMKIDLK